MEKLYQILKSAMNAGVRLKNNVYNGLERFLDWIYEGDYNNKQKRDDSKEERHNNYKNLEDKTDW